MGGFRTLGRVLSEFRGQHSEIKASPGSRGTSLLASPSSGLAYDPPTAASATTGHFPCASLSAPPLTRTPVIPDVGTVPFCYKHMLTNYIRKTPISINDHIHRHLELRLQLTFLGKQFNLQQGPWLSSDCCALFHARDQRTSGTPSPFRPLCAPQTWPADGWHGGN